jgi:transcriptional regulator with XRE-family HTH domain
MTTPSPPLSDRVGKILAELDKLRIEKRLDKKALSLRIGHGDGYFNHLLTGKIALGVDHLFLILDALGVEEEDFFARLYRLSREPRGEAAREAFLETVDPDGILRLLVEKRLEALQRQREDEEKPDDDRARRAPAALRRFGSQISSGVIVPTLREETFRESNRPGASG